MEAGRIARPELLYQVAIKEVIISGTGVSPVQAQANACCYMQNYSFERNLGLKVGHITLLIISDAVRT